MPRTDVLLPALLHGLPDAVVGVGADGVVRIWNAGAARLFAVAEADALGRPLDEVLGGELRQGRARVRGAVVLVAVDVVALEPDAGAPASPGALRHIFIARPAADAKPSLVARLGDRLGVEELPPRLQETLAGLVEGLSEKELAAKMSLSQHTVHDYVKALYRRLGVQSRAALVAHVMRTALEG